MTARRDKRTQRWFFRCRVTHDGIRERISGTPGVSGPYHDLPNTKAGALEAERRAITKVMTGIAVRPVPRQEVPMIREYADGPFMTLYAAGHKSNSKRDKRQRLDAYILPAVGHLRLDELRQEHVDGIVATMLARPEGRNGRKGINTALAVLSSLVGYAVANKLIADPELRLSIKVQDVDLEAVDPADVVRLVDAAKDPRFRVAILLAADAGLRVGEIRALPWLEVNELARELTVAWAYDRGRILDGTKGWERRTVPISDRLWEAMRAVKSLGVSNGPLVIARRDHEPLSYDYARDTLHEIYVAAKVDPPSQPWHALRHTFGTGLARTGVDIETIARLMGHKDINTVRRYLHTDRETKRAAIAALAGG